ncbi:MAG: hypothetical protein MI744_20975 [Pseudomonadales bacterium]|nr:hypothetical protein [Pseudomonadales bacterium]
MHGGMNGKHHFAKVRLETLNSGEASDLFEAAFTQIKEDMMDLAKDPDEDRKITLTFTFSPKKGKSGSRGGDVGISVGCKAKLAAYIANDGVMTLTESEEGELEGYQSLFVQGELETFMGKGMKKETGSN